MEKSIETQASSVDLAVEKALVELGVSKDKVDVEVVSKGGLFSKAKVRVTVKDSVADKMAEFFNGTLSRMGPGFFPTALGVILALLGCCLSLRALLFSGYGDGSLEGVNWGVLGFILGSVAVFAVSLLELGVLRVYNVIHESFQ